LLAAVSAPPLHTATVKHIEVLRLQEQVVLVVVITSTGAVSKRAFTFDEPVDAGLADWGASYLNERLAGTDLGALTLKSKLDSPELSKTERSFLEAVSPAFSDLAETVEQTVYVEGTARLLESRGFEDVGDINNLLRMLERRDARDRERDRPGADGLPSGDHFGAGSGSCPERLRRGGLRVTPSALPALI